MISEIGAECLMLASCLNPLEVKAFTSILVLHAFDFIIISYFFLDEAGLDSVSTGFGDMDEHPFFFSIIKNHDV